MLAQAKQIAFQKLANQGIVSYRPDTVQKEIDEYFSFNQHVKYQGVLDAYIDNEWDIRAEDIYELTGSRIRIKKGKSSWNYGSYSFIPSGKHGRKTCYQIYKAGRLQEAKLDNNHLRLVQSHAIPPA